MDAENEELHSTEPRRCVELVLVLASFAPPINRHPENLYNTRILILQVVLETFPHGMVFSFRGAWSSIVPYRTSQLQTTQR